MGFKAWRRLALYVTIMILRGFVLYQGMNQVEQHLLSGKNQQDGCWYDAWLRPDQSTCYGRGFDFSDHMVLYYAQILPIVLVETLDAIQEYCRFGKTTRTATSTGWFLEETTTATSLLNQHPSDVNSSGSSDSSFGVEDDDAIRDSLLVMLRVFGLKSEL